MTVTITIKALSEVSRILGWSEKEVQFEGATVEGLLKSLVTLDGQSLHSVIVKDGKVKGGYVISVNGRVVTSLETPLNPGDRVVTMEVIRLFHGG